MKWNNKEIIIIRRTINDFHCCKILILQNYVVPPTFHGDHLRIKLRVSLAAAGETFLAVVSHGRQLYFYLVWWNTRLVPTVMHPAPCVNISRAMNKENCLNRKLRYRTENLKAMFCFFFFFRISDIKICY